VQALRTAVADRGETGQKGPAELRRARSRMWLRDAARDRSGAWPVR